MRHKIQVACLVGPDGQPSLLGEEGLGDHPTKLTVMEKRILHAVPVVCGIQYSPTSQLSNHGSVPELPPLPVLPGAPKEEIVLRRRRIHGRGHAWVIG